MLNASDGLVHSTFGAPLLVCPVGVACTRGGTLLVADNKMHCVHAFDTRAAPWRALPALGMPFKAGSASNRFDTPQAVAVFCDNQIDSSGSAAAAERVTIFVADWKNNRVQVFDAATNELRASIGSTSTGLVRQGSVGVLRQTSAGGAGAGQLGGPCGLLVHDALLYVAESINGRVSVFDARAPHEFRGVCGAEGTGVGQFRSPVGLAIDADAAELYVSDDRMHRVSVHRWF